MMGCVLVVDAANVIGSRPDGWWRDRAGAARRLVEHLRAAAAAGALVGPVVVVLEGAARPGVGPGTQAAVRVVHAPGAGDDTLLAEVSAAAGEVVLVSADRELRTAAVRLGARVVGPSWLHERLDQAPTTVPSRRDDPPAQ
jgi:hypothetical protein